MQQISNQKTARIAGLLYLVVVLTGMFSLAYVPSQLIVWDNPAKTIENIINHDTLYRLGIVSSSICYVFFIFLPLVLYKLLQSTNNNYAKLMVILAVVSVPISFVNMQNKYAVLSLITESGIAKEQLQSQVMFYLNQYNSGILIVQIFWGLWLFPFGYLVFKSKLIPKLFGILLMAGCVGYLINFIGHTLISGYAESGISTFIRLPASIGEIGICFWLLIMGVKKSSKDLIAH